MSILFYILTSELNDINPYIYIESHLPMIIEQTNLRLSLTDNQINHLKRIKVNNDFQLLVANRLKQPTREFLETLPNNDKTEIINKMVNHE